LGEIKTLLEVPGNRPTSGNVGGDTYLSKADEALRQAKSALLKADLLDGEKKAGGIGEARAKLEKAKELLEDAADDADESTNEDGIEKVVSRLRSLTDKVAKAEIALLQRGVRVPDTSKSTLPTVTPAELMAAVAGRGTAQSFLAEFEIAKAGRLPMAHFMNHLATKASPRVAEVFGMEVSAPTLRMIQ
jgi:hypothetical protein